jgi:hypothetical protein
MSTHGIFHFHLLNLLPVFLPRHPDRHPPCLPTCFPPSSSLYPRTQLTTAAQSRIDDSDSVTQLIRLVGRTFLATLARLERERLLVPDSEVKNVGLVMSLFIKVARDMYDNDLLEEGQEETVKLRAADGSMTRYTFDLANFDEYILGYAERHGIMVPGLSPDEGTAEMLPVQTAEDPWNTAGAFRKYEENHGRASGPDETPAIGGDKYDITTWTSVERASASFNKRDPFSKKELVALKLGFLLSWE